MGSITVIDSARQVRFEPTALLVAGYTGRDPAAVQHHIDELAKIGVAPPPQVPMVYDLDPALLTSANQIAVATDSTSGEVEPVLLRHRGRWFLTVGSDHTDRYLEQADIKAAKAICAKVTSDLAVPIPGDPLAGAFDEVWDTIRITSAVDGTEYQSGTLAQMLRPSALLPVVLGHTRAAGDDDLAVFCGTVPTLGGDLSFGRDWTLGLRVGDVWLRHTYEVRASRLTAAVQA